MTLLARPRTRSAFAAAAATLGLALLAAAPAQAAEGDDPSYWNEAIPYNGGTIIVDAGPEYAGYDVFVQSQLPRTLGGEGELVTYKASLDASGVASLDNFAGPVNVFFLSPSAEFIAGEVDLRATAAIYRGAGVEFDIDPVAQTATVDGAIPAVTAPAFETFEAGVVPFTEASVAPSSYYVGEAFDLTFSDLFWETPGDLDGQTTTTVIYSAPTTIGTSAVSGGAVTTTIGAEYTTDPHTVGLMDSYGRFLAIATLDGGAAAAPEAEPTAEPTSTPVAAAPVVNTGTKTGTKTHLAETGVDAGVGALAAGALLVAGAGGLVVARRRRATA